MKKTVLGWNAELSTRTLFLIEKKILNNVGQTGGKCI